MSSGRLKRSASTTRPSLTSESIHCQLVTHYDLDTRAVWLNPSSRRLRFHDIGPNETYGPNQKAKELVQMVENGKASAPEVMSVTGH